MQYGELANVISQFQNAILARLTDGNSSICMPRFNPQGTKLVCCNISP